MTKPLLLAAACALSCLCAVAQPLATYTFETGTAPTTSNPAVIGFQMIAAGGASIISRQAAPFTPGDIALYAGSFPTSTTPGGYFQARISGTADFDVTGLSGRFESTTGGPTAVIIQYSRSVSFSDPVTVGTFPVVAGVSNTITAPALESTLRTFVVRIFPIGATTAINSIALGEFVINGALAAPLPLDFTSVAAKTLGQDIEVTWTTAQQRGVERFEVLASFGESPELRTVATVDAGGDSAAEQTFRTTFPANDAAVAYVQVIGIDHDGTRTLSEIVAAGTGARAGGLRLLSFVGEVATVTSASAKTLDITTATGQRLTTVAFDARGVASVDLQSIPNGVLFLSAGEETLRLGLAR